MNETELVALLNEHSRQHPRVSLGPGDDCALLTEHAGRELALSVDSSVENVHFWPDTPPEVVGRRALAGALSDLAAMAASPLLVLVNLQLPKDRLDAAKPIYSGMDELLQEYYISLAGGNITGGECVAVTTTVAGELYRGGAVTRDGGSIGEYLYVTGDLGRARSYVVSRELGFAPGEWAAERFESPQPRIREMLQLKAEGLVTAAIDISDGLGMDGHRLGLASGAELLIEAESVPVRKEVVQLARQVEMEPVELVLGSGEEYELLFLSHRESIGGLSFTVTRIGQLREGRPGGVISLGDREFPAAGKGWDHLVETEGN